MLKRFIPLLAALAICGSIGLCMAQEVFAVADVDYAVEDEDEIYAYGYQLEIGFYLYGLDSYVWITLPRASVSFSTLIANSSDDLSFGEFDCWLDVYRGDDGQIYRYWEYDFYLYEDFDRIAIRVNTPYLKPDPNGVELFHIYSHSDFLYSATYDVEEWSWGRNDFKIWSEWRPKTYTDSGLMAFSLGESSFHVLQDTPFSLVGNTLIEFSTQEEAIDWFVLRVPAAYGYNENMDITRYTMITDTNLDQGLHVIQDGEDLPTATEWIASMLDGFLGIQFFPGITVGGILLAFIAVCAVIALLKLWAGG